MRFLIAFVCFLNVAWAEDLADEIIRGLEKSERQYQEETRRNREFYDNLAPLVSRKSEAQKLREEIESDRLQEQTYRFQMLDQMERLNKNLEDRHRR